MPGDLELSPEEQHSEWVDEARILGGEEGVAYLESVPAMPSLELAKLAFNTDAYPHLREAATVELEARCVILDEIVAERRAVSARDLTHVALHADRQYSEDRLGTPAERGAKLQ